MGTEANAQSQDPRISLAAWANTSDEWIRRIVQRVLGSNGELSENERAQAFRLFLEEKGFEDRILCQEPPLEYSSQALGEVEPFRLVQMSDVRGVNALAEGGQIDFAPGLTLLFGENGTGKTGYSRILKTMAGSRSADVILPDVNLEGNPLSPSAGISYRLGGTGCTYQWNGERAQQPFDRMSIFDSPSVHLHVDSELNYTYIPASLAVFDRVTVEVQKIGTAIEEERGSLNLSNSALIDRFNNGSTIYPLIQSLGATTDLTELQPFAHLHDDAKNQKCDLEATIARLRANAIAQDLSNGTGFQRVLTEGNAFASVVASLEVHNYNGTLSTLFELRLDQERLRDGLFAAADLPADPDTTWEAFIRSGNDYRLHLENSGAHDGTRCLYCRQTLGGEALELISKYGEYLEDKIATDIRDQEAIIHQFTDAAQRISLATVRVYIEGIDSDAGLGSKAGDNQIDALRTIIAVDNDLRKRFADRAPIDENIPAKISAIKTSFESWLTGLGSTLEELRQQNSNREETIKEKEQDLHELTDRITLNEVWSEVKNFVAMAKRAERLNNERQSITTVLRRITVLARTASQKLISENFHQIFLSECAALRAPDLKLEFAGREGQPLRRRALPSNHKPSSVLSEGEQKVVALADFISEVRMSDNGVPVIFDDPVSSLDHRRVREVAERIAGLASDHQVVVFTHDIFFTVCLLDIFDKSDDCVYYSVTDEDGKGTVTLGTGPRWDTIGNFRAKINSSIEEAKKTSGEARGLHVREAYGFIRSWCELFVEQEVLAKVTERYQPNVRMTNLEQIKVSVLRETIETVSSVFSDACRYIEGHSQPLPTLGLAPTLSQLQNDWAELQKCRSDYRKALS